MEAPIKYLLIDDERNIHCDIVCRRPDDGIKALIYMGPFDVLYLDHDMGFGDEIRMVLDDFKIEHHDGVGIDYYEFSGYGVACFIEKHPEYAPETTELVSSNPAGIARMAAALKSVYPYAKGRTFSKHDLNEKNIFSVDNSNKA